MGAIWFRLRAERRSRWRAWLGLAVLAGVFGGAVVAAAAGAVRTGSVVDRNLAATHPPDVYLLPEYTVAAEDPELLAKLTLENLTALPSVADGARTRILPDEDQIDAVAVEDPRAWHDVLRTVIVTGRFPDPAAVDEAGINFLAAEELGLKPGDTYTIHFAGVAAGPDSGSAAPPPGPAVTVRITGVGANLADVVKVASPAFFLTPAFLARYGDQISSGDHGLALFALKLHHGPASYAAFERDLAGLSGGKVVPYVKAENGVNQVRDSFAVQAASLWIVAAFLALVTILVLSQTIARQTLLDSEDHPTLGALGWSRRQLMTMTMIRSAGIGLAAATLAVAAAIPASRLAPFGRARLVDPHRGLSAPAVPLLLGFAGVLVSVLALTLAPAWRAARRASRGLAAGGQETARRPSRLAQVVGRLASRPAAGIGTRMALEPGRGRTAVPVRTTIAATCIAVTGLTAALVVGGSLGRIRTTPRIYGWDWNVTVGADFGDPAAQRKLAEVPGVRDVAFGAIGGVGTVVDDVQVDGVGVRIGDRIHPPILEGRAPGNDQEVALARRTMRATGKRVGDTVQFGLQGSPKRIPLRVVGVTVVPFEGDVSTLGQGFFVRIEAVQRLLDTAPDAALVRFDPTAAPGAVTARIRELFGPDSVSFADPPLTVIDFGHVSSMPYLLAALVGLLGAGTLTHGVVTAVRRRRRDLAVLKALGLDRGQVRRAVVWQATATVLLALVVGIPLGVVIGWRVWDVLASHTGFLSEPVVNVATVGLVVPAALVLGTLVAALPGRSAARIRPALVLRAE